MVQQRLDQAIFVPPVVAQPHAERAQGGPVFGQPQCLHDLAGDPRAGQDVHLRLQVAQALLWQDQRTQRLAQ